METLEAAQPAAEGQEQTRVARAVAALLELPMLEEEPERAVEVPSVGSDKSDTVR